jgi:dTDP-4-dehydrorhamnose reductase
MNPTKILLTGANGLLGSHIYRLLSFKPDIRLLPTFRDPEFRFPEELSSSFVPVILDLTSESMVWNIISQWKPDVVIHTAGLTEPGACQWQPKEAEKQNTHVVKTLASLCNHFNIRLIFISTDLVFDGAKGDYLETDQPHPINVYGQTKLEAEHTITGIMTNYMILRTSLLLGPSLRTNRSLDERLCSEAKENKTLTFFTDEYRNPISASVLAGWICDLLEGENAKINGLFHAAGPEKVSRFELGQRLCNKFRILPDNYRGIEQSEMALSTPRPKDCSMISHSLLSLTGFNMPSLDEMINKL